MPPQNRIWNAQLGPHLAHFILEQFTQRFNEFHVHLFRQAAHIVVALDHRARPFVRDGFDDVRVQRALGQKVHLHALRLDGLRFPVEHLDEGMPDDLALFLRVFHAFQTLEEEIRSLHILEIEIEMFAQVADHFLTFVPAQHPVVHKDAVQAMADGLVQQHRHHGGIHPAGQRADHMAVAHGFAALADHTLHKGTHTPVGGNFGHVEQEIAEHRLAVLAVRHLWMEL